MLSLSFVCVEENTKIFVFTHVKKYNVVATNCLPTQGVSDDSHLAKEAKGNTVGRTGVLNTLSDRFVGTKVDAALWLLKNY